MESRARVRADILLLLFWSSGAYGEGVGEMISCLRCGERFNSKGKWHRICQDCKEMERETRWNIGGRKEQDPLWWLNFKPNQRLRGKV